MTEKEVVQTPEQILAGIAVASAEGNLTEVIKLGNQLKKHQGEIQKAEMSKLKAEADAMAEGREKLAKSILSTITGLGLGKELDKVKAKGFTYHTPDDQSNVPRLALTVPTIKTRTGGGGGSTGSLKAQTGLSRHELVEKYATETEKAGIAKAESEATSRPDSARYTAEKPVIKRILADNQHEIKR